MERMKSLVSPPRRKKKQELAAGGTDGRSFQKLSPRIFGVALDELAAKASDSITVPQVVRRICEYIYRYGLDSVDLFSVNASASIVEKMRMQFELIGDVNLEEENDAAATARLLMVFLRDLPDSLIPGRLTKNLFSIIQDPQLSRETIVSETKKALNLLPEQNYSVLKYICSLLVVVAANEARNSQSTISLATIFGPTVFRYDSTEDLEVLDYSKDVMHLFICDYSLLFLEKSEPSPQDFWAAQCMKEKLTLENCLPPNVQTPSVFTFPSIENINPILITVTSSSSLDHQPNLTFQKVDETRTDMLQYLDNVERKEMLAGEDMNKENEESYPEKYNEKTEDGSPEYKAKSMHVSDKRTLSLQAPTYLEHFYNHQSSPSSSSGPGMTDWSPGSSLKLFIPPLDLSTLHQHVEGVDPIPMSHEQSDTDIWIKSNQLTGPEDAGMAVLSPRSYMLKKCHDCAELKVPVSVVIEAPLSPSAYFDSGLFRASLDTDIPPSPLRQQDLYKKHSDDDCSNYHLRQLTMKIQGLKKKIHNFEEVFERDHGYRPSHGEKSAQPDIKKYMNELLKARKDLKCLKEDTEKENRSRHSSSASSSGMEMSPPVMPSVAMTFEFILQCLEEKRQESGRPKDVMMMSREQLLEEKLAIQRALLHFEKLHGRPTMFEDRDLMRPLYDRYRSVKRLLVKSPLPCISLELQTVPEDQMMEIPVFITRESSPVCTGRLDPDDIGALDFELTKDLVVFEGLDLPKCLQQTDRGEKNETGTKSEDAGGDSRLHEMSLSELHAEIEMSRMQKKRLRRVLREYEGDFLIKNGRKAQKEDRCPLLKEYGDYKVSKMLQYVKAK